MKYCKLCEQQKSDNDMLNYSLYVGEHISTEGTGYGQVLTHNYKDVHKVEVTFCKECLSEIEKKEWKTSKLGCLLVAVAILFVLGTMEWDDSSRYVIFLPLLIGGAILLFRGGVGRHDAIFRISRDLVMKENERYNDSKYTFFDKSEYKNLQKK